MVLSAQATDAGVNKATPALFKAADTPAKMAALGEARVRELIKTIGLYRTKAKNVVALSKKLVAEHGGAVPPSREALEALPGVGRKTANVVLNVAFGEPTIAVDTHIFRVGNRTGLATGKTPHDVEMKLNEVVPDAYKRHAHHWLILHGRYVCVARRPLCEKCLIARPVQVAGEDHAPVPDESLIATAYSNCDSSKRDAERCRSRPRRVADQPLVHVHHEGHAEQRRRQVDDRDRHERRDEHAGDKHRALVQPAQPPWPPPADESAWRRAGNIRGRAGKRSQRRRSPRQGPQPAGTAAPRDKPPPPAGRS